jgi:hypothetical protein
MKFEDVKLSLQVITQEYKKKVNLRRLSYSGIRRPFLKIESSRSLDRLAELAVFTGCSSGAVCFTSYHQCAQSGIFDAPNSMLIWLLY